MELLSINNVYLKEQIAWTFRFNDITSIPTITFNVQYGENPNLKTVYLSNTRASGNDKILGELNAQSFFKQDDDDEDNSWDELTIKKIIVNYNNGTEVIEFTINADYPLEATPREQGSIAQGLTYSREDYLTPARISDVYTDNPDYFIQMPGYLTTPFNEVIIYTATLDTQWIGYSQPELITQDDFDELFERDEDYRLKSGNESDGKVYIIATKDSKDELKPINRDELILFRTNGVITWTETVNKNDILSNETIKYTDAILRKTPLEFNKEEVNLGHLTTGDGIFINQGDLLYNYKGMVLTPIVNEDDDDIEDPILVEATRIKIDYFGRVE